MSNDLLNTLAIKNILEFFDKRGSPKEYDGEYTKVAYELFNLIRSNASSQIIDSTWDKLKNIPITYCEIRMLYG